MASEKWWDKSITLVEGCSPVSAGCQHCWSAAMTHRFHGKQGLTNKAGKFNGKIVCRNDRLVEILKRKKPTKWTIWNDLFHESVPYTFFTKAMCTVEQCKQHTFQVLTKRIKRMAWCFEDTPPPANLWLGVTAENQEMADKRIPILLQIPAAVRFVSIEPCLGPVDLRLIEGHIVKTTRIENGKPCYRNLDTGGRLSQIIIGAESGPGARYCPIENIRSVVEQCKSAGVKCFIKQMHLWGVNWDNRLFETKQELLLHLGEVTPKMKLIKDISLFPADLQIREYPKGGV